MQLPSTKSKVVIYFLGLLFLGFVTQSYYANPPDGNTGAPGDGLCTNCHNPGNPEGLDGSINISGLPSSITPGNTYTITLTSMNPNGLADRSGFQMVVLDDDNTNAGSLSNPSSDTEISTSGGRTYFEHDPAADFPASNQVSWTVDWTAPSAPNGTQITVYAANNIANGDGTNNDDYIVTNQVSGTIMGSDPLSVTITSTTDVSCFGGSDGSATAEASGGTPSYTYNWSNGDSGPMITNLSAGNYTVTVTDSEGSTATATATISQPSELVVSGIANDVSCNGGSDGSISTNTSGGTSPYTYSWSNGDSGSSISNLSAGTYTVTVTDNNGCTDMASFTVEEPPPITINTTAIQDVSCNGGSDGFANVEASGGTPPFTYNWSNGTSGPSNSNLSAGMYTVTATDDNGCTNSLTISIDEPAPLVVTTTAMDESSQGANDGSVEASVTGGTSPYMYDWSNGDTGNPITGLPPGIYTVTVTDDNGCTATSTDTVEAFDCPLTVSIEIEDSIDCYGDQDGSLVAIAMNGPNPTFSWSNGANGDTITGLGAGTYIVTVTDDNNCTATASYTLTQPDSISISIMTEDESENNADDGEATASASGGTSPYSYAWSNGETGPMIDSLAPGTYTVTVTDDNGCTSTADAVINPFGCDLAIGINQTSDILCAGDSTAGLEVILTEGGPIATVNWSTGDTTTMISGLPAGMYSVTVTDTNACVENANITVEEPEPIELTVTATDETENNANDGTAQAMVSGGTSPYEYLWSNGAMTDSIGDLSPGTYTVTVTDQNGCTATGSAIVNPFGCDLDISAETMDPLCADSLDGEICITVSGGSRPYSTTWNTGSNDTCLTGIGAGSYSVTVVDDNNCSITDTFNLEAPDSIAIQIVEVVPSDPGESNGSIDIDVSGGTPEYEFEWYLDGELVSTDEDPMNLASGMYTLDLTDNNGCMVSFGPVEVPMEVATVDPSDKILLEWYPNPASEQINLRSDQLIEQVIISSIEGRAVIHREDIDNKECSLSIGRLPEGMYLLQLQWSNGTHKVIQFIKQ